MKVWRVESRWSTELVMAESLMAARNKYLRKAKKEISEAGFRYLYSIEPVNITLIGKAI